MLTDRVTGPHPETGSVQTSNNKDLGKLAEEFSALFMKSVFEKGFDALLPADNSLQAQWADTMWCKLSEAPFPLTVHIMKILAQQNPSIHACETEKK